MARSGDHFQPGGIFRIRCLAWVTRRAGADRIGEAQCFGGGFGQVAVECEVAQPGGQRGRQSGELQPYGVAVVVDRGQVAGASGLELLDPVFDVGLGAVAGVEELQLSAGGVGGERPVLPVGVLAEFGLLSGRSGDTAGDDPQVNRPAGHPVPARAGDRQPDPDRMAQQP